MNILLIGKNSNFSKYLLKYDNNHNWICPSKTELDIRYYDNVCNFFKKHHAKFESVIHVAAISRPMNIHNTNPTLSIHTNIIGTANVSILCEKYNKKMIYISTDYIYPGTDGDYKESDTILPFTKYGWSKLGGECSVQMLSNFLILRMGIINKPFPHERALSDVKKSSIYDDDAAKLTLQLLNETGIINVGGDAKTIHEFISESIPTIKKINTTEISDVEVPSNCSMNLTKLNTILNEKNSTTR